MDLYSALLRFIYNPLRYGIVNPHAVLPATHTFIHKKNESYLVLLPSHTASLK